VEEAVVVEGLRHQYGQRIALDEVSFKVAAGECFGLLGPNGGGKTTLFRILTTLLTPTAGRASIFADDVLHARDAVRQKIGVVFQSPSLDIYLSVRENLIHGGHLYGLAGAELESRAGESLARFGIADRARDLVKSLSGGLRRRVEIAKCLLHRPPLLILDEPSTGLDPVARRELWDQLERMRGENGLTILVTTHDMEEAERCNRLVILDRGRVVASGAPADLKARIAKSSISIEAVNPQILAGELNGRFGVKPAVIGNTVRLLEDHDPSFPGELLTTYGDSIRSLTVGKPTLGDVFMHVTGRVFEEDHAEHESRSVN
jgi:ABC-2 type transport system ATP-binding protein